MFGFFLKLTLICESFQVVIVTYCAFSTRLRRKDTDKTEMSVHSILLLALLVSINSIQPSDAGELSGLLKSLSFKKQKENPIYQDMELEPLTPSKSNKVSKVLHFLHHKSQDAVYLPDEMDAQEGKDGETKHFKLERSGSKKWEGKSDDEVVEHICDDKPTRSCTYGLKLAKKASPEARARLARAFRKKPDHVNATHLLFHILFENGIKMMEEKKYDEKLDKMIDLAIAKNPYALAASKAVNMAL